jgi:hypothetical protein
MDALAAAGAAAVRVPAYLTSVGLPSPECSAKEAALLQQGHFDAIAFSSTAEVGSEGLKCHVMCTHVHTGPFSLASLTTCSIPAQQDCQRPAVGRRLDNIILC